jgi:hypothetical protein
VPTIKGENVDGWWARRSRAFVHPTPLALVIASAAKQFIVASGAERWVASLRSQYVERARAPRFLIMMVK